MVRFPQGAIAQLGERVNAFTRSGFDPPGPPISLVSFAGVNVSVPGWQRHPKGWIEL